MNDILSGKVLKPSIAPKHVRIFAICLDYLVFILILWIFYGSWFKPSGQNIGFGIDLINPNSIITFLLWLVVFPLPEGFKGQTLGKRLFRVKVISRNYSQASYGQCFVRHLFDVIDFLPFFGIVGLIVSSNNKMNQRIGDLLGGTIVVDSLRTT